MTRKIGYRMNIENTSNLQKRFIFEPTLNANCLCGSGKKFKRCCSDTYKNAVPGQGARLAFGEENYKDALVQCRAEITRYTTWHKTNTEPAIREGIKEFKDMLNIDIQALSDLVDLLFHCYIKTNRLDEFPAVLERLRQNINDERWQRKISYFHVLCTLWPDWDEAKGKREFKKLGAMHDEADVNILQLYLDLFSSDLPFSKKIILADKIVHISDNNADKLHYSAYKASQYISIGDQSGAEEVLTEAIKNFKEFSDYGDPDYHKNRLAQVLEFLGEIKSDKSLISESIKLCKQLLGSNNWTQEGKAELYWRIGDSYRHMSVWEDAKKAYESAIDLYPKAIFKVFLSESLFYLENYTRAESVILSIDTSDLNASQYVDYLFVFSLIAIGENNRSMLEYAEKRLRILKVSEPYFRERRDSLLLSVIETQKNGVSSSILNKAKQAIFGMVRSATKYAILQPNVMGFGIDLGKIINDLTSGAEKHKEKNVSDTNKDA